MSRFCIPDYLAHDERLTKDVVSMLRTLADGIENEEMGFYSYTLEQVREVAEFPTQKMEIRFTDHKEMKRLIDEPDENGNIVKGGIWDVGRPSTSQINDTPPEPAPEPSPSPPPPPPNKGRKIRKL